jgi:uncharacterized membrane protein
VKILLLNDNPVVNKLVTLSAQKTSNEVDIASTIEGIESQNYDLLIVDDSVYSDDLLNNLHSKIKYKKSLYICAKDAEEVESFSSILKKPFLPTDLVELFTMFEKEIAQETSEETDEETNEETNEDLNLDDEENLGESVLDDEEAQKVKDLLDENEEELSFEEEVQSDIESLELDEFEFDEEELSLEDDLESVESETEQAETEEEDASSAYDLALDLEDEADADISLEDSFDLEDEVEALEDEELQELETATVEELEDEIDEVVTDELNAKEGDLAFDLALDLEDEADADISHDIIDELSLDEVPEANEEPEELAEVEETEDVVAPEELAEVEETEDVTEPMQEMEDVNLEDEIQNAVENLTQEDLESELDEDTLLQIATNEIDPLAELTSKDLKMALGEEVDEQESEVFNDAEAINTPEIAEIEETQDVPLEQNSGVQSLKKLLEVLSDKDIAASLRGAKISINITLGDN